ncbi:hypothetical protein Tco_1579386, partial [Tanacetum coccineum]
GEESHRNIFSIRTTKPAATAFLTKTVENNKKRFNNNNNHKRYPAGYVKKNFKSNSRPVSSNNASAESHSNGVSSNNATTSNSHVSLSSKQLARLMNLLNENVVSTANANMAGLTVGHPNGTQALITKIGDLKINNEATLYDVLVVPEYTVSLLSVHKLSRDNKLFVVFNESNCYIQDLKANKTVRIDPLASKTWSSC